MGAVTSRIEINYQATFIRTGIRSTRVASQLCSSKVNILSLKCGFVPTGGTRATATDERLRDVEQFFMRLTPGGFQVYVEGPSTYPPFGVLADARVELPSFETAEDDTTLKRPNWEGLANIEGDVLFYVVGGGYDSPEGQLETNITLNLIWQALPAVRNGNAHHVSTEHRMRFGGLASVNAVSDDVERYLVEE